MPSDGRNSRNVVCVVARVACRQHAEHSVDLKESVADRSCSRVHACNGAGVGDRAFVLAHVRQRDLAAQGLIDACFAA